MKKLNLLMYAVTFLITVNALAQAPTKENIYTLKANESIVYGENCFSFSDQGRNIFFVFKGNAGYSIYDNSAVKGPFKEMNDNLLKPCNQKINTCAFFEQENADASSYTVANDDGTASISINGKTYGPFMGLLSFQISEDKSKFVAQVVEQNMSKKIISSSGKTMSIDGLASTILMSPDGSFFVMMVGFDYTQQNLDPTKITMEQMSSFNIITSDGIKFGPFNTDKVTASDVWFTRTTGNHWFLKNGDDLLLDGKPFIKMPESGAGRCDIWFSADCKRYAISNYEKVKFSDGSSIPYPIQTTLFYKDGKAYLRCVTLENDRELNVYTKAL